MLSLNQPFGPFHKCVAKSLRVLLASEDNDAKSTQYTEKSGSVRNLISRFNLEVKAVLMAKGNQDAKEHNPVENEFNPELDQQSDLEVKNGSIGKFCRNGNSCLDDYSI